MYSALALVFLFGSASAETGYDRNGTNLATPKPVGSVNPLIVGGAPHHGPHMVTLQKAALTRAPRCSAGGPVTPNEHNWVLMWEGLGYMCGASLIDEQWAMIAAHCTDGVYASEMEVHVHRHALNGGAGEHECAETLKITEKFEHPDYNFYDFSYSYDHPDYKSNINDIALLRLSQVHPTPPHTPWQIDTVSPLTPSPFTRFTFSPRSHDTSVPPAAAGRLRRLHHQGLSRRRQLQRCRYDCHRGGVGHHFRRWLDLRRAALRRPQAAHQR